MTLYLIESTDFAIIKTENTLIKAEEKKKELKEKNSSSDFQIRKIQSQLFEKEIELLKNQIISIKEKFLFELTEIISKLANEKVEIKIEHYSQNAISIMVYLGTERTLLKYVFYDTDINNSLDVNTLIVCPMRMGNHSQFTNNGNYKKMDVLIGKIWEHQDQFEKIFDYLDNYIFTKYNNYLDVLNYIKILEQMNTKKGEK